MSDCWGPPSPIKAKVNRRRRLLFTAPDKNHILCHPSGSLSLVLTMRRPSISVYGRECGHNCDPLSQTGRPGFRSRPNLSVFVICNGSRPIYDNYSAAAAFFFSNRDRNQDRKRSTVEAPEKSFIYKKNHFDLAQFTLQRTLLVVREAKRMLNAFWKP